MCDKLVEVTLDDLYSYANYIQLHFFSERPLKSSSCDDK